MTTVGESTSRETAIAAMAVGMDPKWWDSVPEWYRDILRSRAALAYDALIASRRVVPIEEHESALARLQPFLDECDKVHIPYDAEGLVRHHRNAAAFIAACQADVEHAAALADTQHPSTPEVWPEDDGGGMAEYDQHPSPPRQRWAGKPT